MKKFMLNRISIICMGAMIALTLVTSAVQAGDIVDQMQEKGYTKCSSSSREVWEFLIKNNKSSWISTFNKNEVNKFPWYVLAAKGYSDGEAIISLSIVNTPNDCNIRYVKSEVFNKSCTWVRENFIPKAKFKEEWGVSSAVYELSGVTYVLTSVVNGAGCQTIKEEVMKYQK